MKLRGGSPVTCVNDAITKFGRRLGGHRADHRLAAALSGRCINVSRWWASISNATGLHPVLQGYMISGHSATLTVYIHVHANDLKSILEDSANAVPSHRDSDKGGSLFQWGHFLNFCVQQKNLSESRSIVEQ